MAAGQFPGPGTSREWSPRIAVGAIFRVSDDTLGARVRHPPKRRHFGERLLD
jgi:hypothetical protein